jgi:hypothetical protein
VNPPSALLALSQAKKLERGLAQESPDCFAMVLDDAVSWVVEEFAIYA